MDKALKEKYNITFTEKDKCEVCGKLYPTIWDEDNPMPGKYAKCCGQGFYRVWVCDLCQKENYSPLSASRCCTPNPQVLDINDLTEGRESAAIDPTPKPGVFRINGPGWKIEIG